jgi:hypothetical protein
LNGVPVPAPSLDPPSGPTSNRANNFDAVDGIEITSARATEKPIKLFYRDGLYLFVQPSGGRWCGSSIAFHGKERKLSLGVYPEV